MKKVLSVIALIICSLVSVFLIFLLTELVFKAVVYLLNMNSKVLFWIVLLGGGSLVLGIFVSLIFLAANLTITLSQKIALSKKGTRYTVVGTLLLVYYGLNTVIALITRSYPGIQIAYMIVCYLLLIFFCIVLIAQGRETAQEEYIEPTNNTTAINATEGFSSESIPVDSLKALKDLHDSGVISDEEFEMKKKQLLNL